MPKASNPPRKPTGHGKKSAAAPILLRFFGSSGERAGVNGDYFTVGDSPEDNVRLPTAVGGAKGIKMRFSRGAEGWRVTLAGEQPFYLNQQRHQGLTPLRSGDVVRLAPGGSGMQFLVRQQQDASLAKLAARHAPRLLKSTETPAVQETGPNKATAGGTARVGRLPVAAKRLLAAVLLVAVAVAVGYFMGSRPGPTAPATSVPSETTPTK